MKRAAPLFFLILGLVAPSWSQEGRIAWENVPGPKFVSISLAPNNPDTVVVAFKLEIGAKGADRATVTMMDSVRNTLETKLMGRSAREIKTVEFKPPKSGIYLFSIAAARTGLGETKASETISFDFSLPLTQPAIQARNVGKGTMLIGWEPVKEAERYIVSWKLEGAAAAESSVSSETAATISGLIPGRRYAFSVSAIRGQENAISPPLLKLAKAEAEREWFFTWFGQSGKAELNTMEMIDADNFVFKLKSCSFNPTDGQIDLKGGKYTAFHDGISFYYTVIDPKTENFELKATFTVDYINPTADGQEGFGLLALDSLGAHGVSSANHYTNSAGIIATKFEETIDGVKKTSKDTLGARFVSGMTKEIIASGDAGIAQKGTSLSRAYSYDSSDLVRAGDRFTLTLKKTNTGYHAILEKPYATEETVTEYIMYGPEKLLQLDPDHLYVGFSVARGCNVTVSDVSMAISDPRTDPPARKEPPALVPLVAMVDSPSSYTTPSYPFVFTSNADGRLTMKDKDRNLVIDGARVTAMKDFTADIELAWGINDFFLTFTPNPDFRPGEKMALARYDRELRKYVESSEPISLGHTVIYRTIEGDKLYVSPGGSVFGDGSRESPLDLTSALYYAKPGQPILLRGGVYYPPKSVTIERGNDGTAEMRKVLMSAPGERAIFDFGYSASGGMLLAGDYWTIEGIDIRDTPDNVKGLQVAGNDNIVRNVRTYGCGDTGLQISGSSAEPPQKWPRDNLILNCVSHDNSDPAANNADGFAAKLTVGEGNAFRGCLAYHNIDDGWDLFSKIETGPIGAVLIEDCAAYGNGSLSDGSGNGDGNGFKLGGDGIAVPHILRNSLSWINGASGITSNSNPAVIVERCTSYGNKGANISLYGKGDGVRLFRASGLISMGGGTGDVFREMPELAAADNYFWNGAKSVNAQGLSLSADIFVSADTAGIAPEQRDDGSIDMKGLLVLTRLAPSEAGARLGQKP
ncbi:MAG TPA: right-handed parallel beta-helix repeat-containing protein [Rectinemataceae bacterium]|nr:right-handed parallel beta-helix repeat-containing protein [Rectinemataceae bacterium]